MIGEKRMIKKNEIELEILAYGFSLQIQKDNLDITPEFAMQDNENNIFHVDEYDTVPDLDGEYWVDVLGYDGYMVSNLGRIKSLYQTHEMLLEKQLDKNGYETVSFPSYGRQKRLLVHRIVADNFLLNPDNKPTVDHINRKRNDNRLGNLRWATHKEQGQNKSEYTKPQKIVGRDINNNEIKFILDSYSDGKRFGFDPIAISSNVNGHTDSYKGFKFTIEI